MKFKMIVTASCIGIAISAIITFFMFLLFAKVYEQHYEIFDIHDMGIIKISGNEYIYAQGNLASEQKTYASVIVIGKHYDNKNEVNISTLAQHATLKSDGYRFSSSPAVLIPINYFTQAKTVITTGDNHRPIYYIFNKNGQIQIQKIK